MCFVLSLRYPDYYFNVILFGFTCMLVLLVFVGYKVITSLCTFASDNRAT